MNAKPTGQGARGAMQARGWIEVDLDAIRANARALQRRAGVPLLPMIKADAYGLGAVRVAHALEPLEPVAYGVATVAEGAELRAGGISRPIIIFTPILESEFDGAAEASLTPALGTRASIEAWMQRGREWQLSVDTGMSRAGIPWREAFTLRDLVAGYPPAGAFTHFHTPESLPAIEIQEARFAEALAALGTRPAMLHTDSSGAIVRHSLSMWNAVRPGIFLYGVGSGEGAGLHPRCVVRMQARIVETRTLEPGETVSYDATWAAPSVRRIATVPVGYADGYPRNASSKGVGVVRGRAVPIAGRVTMDMIMFDVTDTGAEVGDVLTLVGDPGADNAPIDIGSVAALAGMSPYELLTGLRGRMHRVYSGD